MFDPETLKNLPLLLAVLIIMVGLIMFLVRSFGISHKEKTEYYTKEMQRKDDLFANLVENHLTHTNEIHERMILQFDKMNTASERQIQTSEKLNSAVERLMERIIAKR